MDERCIVNVADAQATARPARAIAIDFESAHTPWPDTSVNIMINFLVLHGECLAIVDGEERPMRWDDGSRRTSAARALRLNCRRGRSGASRFLCPWERRMIRLTQGEQRGAQGSSVDKLSRRNRPFCRPKGA
jgi:hypothetical protein